MSVNETLIPHIGVVTDVRIDTPDVKTFRVNALERIMLSTNTTTPIKADNRSRFPWRPSSRAP